MHLSRITYNNRIEALYAVMCINIDISNIEVYRQRDPLKQERLRGRDRERKREHAHLAVLEILMDTHSAHMLNGCLFPVNHSDMQTHTKNTLRRSY